MVEGALPMYHKFSSQGGRWTNESLLDHHSKRLAYQDSELLRARPFLWWDYPWVWLLCTAIIIWGAERMLKLLCEDMLKQLLFLGVDSWACVGVKGHDLGSISQAARLCLHMWIWKSVFFHPGTCKGCLLWAKCWRFKGKCDMAIALERLTVQQQE